MTTEDGFEIHTDAMREHAGRLRATADRFEQAAHADTGPVAADAFGVVGMALAGDALHLAGLAAAGLAAQAGAVRLVATGIDAAARAYSEVERTIRDGFNR